MISLLMSNPCACSFVATVSCDNFAANLYLCKFGPIEISCFNFLDISCLNEEVETLIKTGVNTFISGGALGFDQMAGTLIAAKKEIGYKIHLVLALPYRNQDKLWPEKGRQIYCYLMESADEVHYVSEAYTDDCIKKRNRYMVERSAYCICALLHSRSGTSQTVRYAKQKNLYVINVAK
jgi:uncharacterized phage-like protein YoqJ